MRSAPSTPAPNHPRPARLSRRWVHLLGLTFYNSPEASPRARVGEVGRLFGKAYAARVSRTAVVYSAGGTLNRLLVAFCVPAPRC